MASFVFFFLSRPPKVGMSAEFGRARFPGATWNVKVAGAEGRREGERKRGQTGRRAAARGLPIKAVATSTGQHTSIICIEDISWGTTGEEPNGTRAGLGVDGTTDDKLEMEG